MSFKNLKRFINHFGNNSEKPISPIYLRQIKRWGSLLPSLFSCLPQALLVKLKDKHTCIHFGVQKDQNFEAHAWVEKNGIIIIGEMQNDNFKSLWTW